MEVGLGLYNYFHFQVVRQNEQVLINAVNKLCDGRPSSTTETFLRSLSRPLQYNHGLTRLYGTNFDVEYVNQDNLEQMPGELFLLKAKDEGI